MRVEKRGCESGKGRGEERVGERGVRMGKRGCQSGECKEVIVGRERKRERGVSVGRESKNKEKEVV